MDRQYRTVEDNLKQIRETIARNAAAAGRDPGEIRLMAVTKTQPPELVNHAVACGIGLLGENRAQELNEKFGAYQKEGVEIHFIGHLQTNKVRQVADKVSAVQSLDSMRLAREMERQCAKLDKIMDVLIEVNIGGEHSKSGVRQEEAEALIRGVSLLPHLRVRGLMAIPPACGNEGEAERYFSRMNQLYVDIKGKNIDNVSMSVLSMGMSDDYPAAIRQGSTMLRLGSAIFGRRQP